MSDIIDDLISNRTFNNPNRHISNINQRLDERNDVYGNFNSRKKLAFNPPIHEDPNRTNIGEITGAPIVLDDIDKGMPLRMEHINMREQPQNYNPNLDFDLYRGQTFETIQYNDPTVGSLVEYADLNGIGHILPPAERLDPTSKLIYTFNKITNSFYIEFLRDIGTFVICPYNLLLSIIVLYRSSKGDVERELSSAFEMTTKDSAFSLAQHIHRSIEQKDSVNITILPNKYPLSPVFQQYVKSLMLVENIKITKQNIDKINNITYSIINSQTLSKNLSFDGYSIINVYNYDVEWKEQFLSIENIKFIGKNIKNIKCATGTQNVLYGENNDIQQIEISTTDSDLFFGVILPKSNIPPTYPMSPQGLQSKNVHIKLPLFELNNRFRMDGLFRKMEFNGLFVDNQYDMSPIPMRMANYIHHTKIKVGLKGKHKAKRIETEKQFFVNHPFLYYLIHKPSGLYIMVGCYE